MHRKIVARSDGMRQRSSEDSIDMIGFDAGSRPSENDVGTSHHMPSYERTNRDGRAPNPSPQALSFRIVYTLG